MVQLLKMIPGVGSITRHLSKDIFVKFVSILLAVVLWYYVGGEDRVNKTVMVPLEIINLPRDLVISNQYKKAMEVSVSGPRSLILEMTEKDVTMQVDLSTATPGSMVFEAKNEDVPVPRGVSVERIQPSSIILSLDKLIQKQFPVRAMTFGQVAEGYFLQSINTEPDMITITGPQTILSQVDELTTRAIDLAGVKDSGQLQVPLELEAAIVELIGETSVTADYIVTLKTELRSISDAKVHVVIDGLRREVVPEKVRVTANIPTMLLGVDTTPLDLLSVTALKVEGQDKLQVRVIPRAGISLPIEVLSIIPPSVSLVKEASDQQDLLDAGDQLPRPLISPEPLEEARPDYLETDQREIPLLRGEKQKIMRP